MPTTTSRAASAIAASASVATASTTPTTAAASAASSARAPGPSPLTLPPALEPPSSSSSTAAAGTSSSSSDAALARLTDLGSRAFGGRVLFATDEWFAPAHRLLLPEPPVFLPEEFTEFGKWMDGWETRRKRIPGNDWCLIELGLRGTIAAVDIDTAFFTGNHAPRVSIQAARFSRDPRACPAALTTLRARASRDREMGRAASEDELRVAGALGSDTWTEILPPTELGPGYPETRHNVLRIASKEPWTHLRVNMYPDGGIARLRVYGTVLMDWAQVPRTQLVDLVAAQHGGQVVAFNDAHYGHPKNLLGPGRSRTMADGWETARKKTRPAVLVADPATGLLTVPGKDWVILRLGHRGIIHEVEVDTNHFKGNYPESCVIYGATVTDDAPEAVLDLPENRWEVLLPRVKLVAHAQQQFSVAAGSVRLLPEGITHVRLEMFPDGGISRLRLRGYRTAAPGESDAPGAPSRL